MLLRACRAVTVMLAVGILLYMAIVLHRRSHAAYQCEMTYMHPSYERVDVDSKLSRRYGLILYRDAEAAALPNGMQLVLLPLHMLVSTNHLAAGTEEACRCACSSRPAEDPSAVPAGQWRQPPAGDRCHAQALSRKLHVPSTKQTVRGAHVCQVRSLASEAARQALRTPLDRGLQWYAADFREERSALDGGLLVRRTQHCCTSVLRRLCQRACWICCFTNTDIGPAT